MASGSSPASRWAWWWCWSSSSSSFIISSSFSAISATDVTLRPTDWGFNSTTTAEGEQLRRQQRPYRILFSPSHPSNIFTSLYFPLHKTNIFIHFSEVEIFFFFLLSEKQYQALDDVHLFDHMLGSGDRVLGCWPLNFAISASLYNTAPQARLMYLHCYIFCLHSCCTCNIDNIQSSAF